MVAENGEEENRMSKTNDNNNNENGLLKSGMLKIMESNFPRDLMAGALMGGMVHTVVAPIERTKLLLQTQDSNIAIVGGKHRRFNGMIDCILHTVKHEGLLSLWRGNGSSVLRYYPSVALNFSLKVMMPFSVKCVFFFVSIFISCIWVVLKI